MKPRNILISVAVAALVLVVAALAFIPKGGGGALPASSDVVASAVPGLVSSGARLVDVRTAAEYAAGHIQGAENVPIDTVPTAAGGWDKAAPIVLYCATGARSANAYEYLKAQGFAKVYNLAGGVATWTGDLVTGTSSGASAGADGPATGRPTMYEFATDS